MFLTFNRLTVMIYYGLRLETFSKLIRKVLELNVCICNPANKTPEHNIVDKNLICVIYERT